MNKCIMMGRLTKDPDYRNTTSGTQLARFGIAVDRKFKREGEPDADFFNCTCFGKQAEFAEKYLKKGTKILLSGRIQNDSYTNRDGQKITSTGILIEEIEFAESKRTQDTAPAKTDDFIEVDGSLDEELPFNF